MQMVSSLQLGLQKCIDKVKQYSEDWKLDMNLKYNVLSIDDTSAMDVIVLV